MPTLAQTLTYLAAVLRLARFDASGGQAFPRGAEGCVQSFFAALLCAPIYIMQVALERSLLEDPGPVMMFWSANAIAYVLFWAAFPLVLYYGSDVLQRRERVFEAITLFNWARFHQLIVIFLTEALVLSKLLGELGQLLGLAVIIYLIVFEIFVLRVGLAVSGIAAALLFCVDLFLMNVIFDLAGAVAAR